MDCVKFRQIFSEETLDDEMLETQRAFDEHGSSCEQCKKWMDALEEKREQEPVGRLLKAVREQGLQKDREGFLKSPYHKKLEGESSLPPEGALGDGSL